MHEAAQFKCSDVAELFIRSGADVHATDEVSTSLIHTYDIKVTLLRLFAHYEMILID